MNHEIDHHDDSGTFPEHSQEIHISTHSNNFIHRIPTSRSNQLYIPTQQSHEEFYQIKENLFQSQSNLSSESHQSSQNQQYTHTMNFGQNQSIDKVMNDSDEMYLNDIEREPISTMKQLNRKNQKQRNNMEVNSQIERYMRNSEILSVDKEQINICVLPEEKRLQSLIVRNNSSQVIEFRVESAFRTKSKTNFFKLDGWSNQQLQFQLGSGNEEQLGDIFQTIIIQYWNSQNWKIKKKILIPLTIRILTGRLTLNFQGNSDILTIPNSKDTHQIACIMIQENSLSEYPLQLSFTQIQGYNRKQNYNTSNTSTNTFNFQIKTHGCIKVFPSIITFLGDQKTKIVIRKDKQSLFQKGALQIKAQNSALIFVFGVTFSKK